MPCRTREAQLAAQRRCYQKNKKRYYIQHRLAGLNRKRALLIDYLKRNPCIDCGESDIVVLEFDHRDRALKSILVSEAVRQGWKWERIEDEIKKCDVVCSNCHRRRTHQYDATARFRTINPGAKPTAPRKVGKAASRGSARVIATSDYHARKLASHRKYREAHKKEAYTYRLNHYRGNRARVLEYLAQNCCADCGEKDILVLEFDHRAWGAKKFNIPSAVGQGYGWDTILTEIQKCDVLCANCHKRRTQRDFNSARFRTQSL